MARKKKVDAESVAVADADELSGFRFVPLETLHEDPGNARTHGEENLAAIRGSLRTFGQVEPLVVQKSTGKVIGGNGRLVVMRAEGWTHAKIYEVDCDDAQAAMLGIALNRSGELATWDEEALALLLPELDRECAELADMITVMEHERARPGAANHEELDAGEEPEDDFDIMFKSPYPWFGGKSRVAGKVWKHFGDVKGYIEPFFGSGAVMLNRPLPFAGTETINDFDALVANFWRACKADPVKLAEYADWPVNENDLHARHIWLVERKDSLQAKLEGDTDFFDVKAAGWWVWGMACWIGGGFCSGNGPWGIEEDEEGDRRLVHLGDAGQGVNRRLVHLGDAGQGVNRKLVEEADGGNAGLGECGLLPWLEALSERFARVRVCCGDWTRICGGRSSDAIQHFFAAGEPCGVFLDPPYADTADRTKEVYRKESLTVAHAVCEWAIAHGDDPRLRICLCAYDGEHKMPDSWKMVSWKAQGGMAGLSDDPNSNGKVNAFRERLWFSPHCV